MLLLAGCGNAASGGGPGTARPAVPAASASAAPAAGQAAAIADPCALVSLDEVAALVRDAPVKAQRTEEGGVVPTYGCDYVDADGGSRISFSIYRDATVYDDTVLPQDIALPGLGVRAVLSTVDSVQVTTGKYAFTVQSMTPVKDGQVSPVIKSAPWLTSGDPLKGDAATSEAAYRLAKLVASRL